MRFLGCLKGIQSWFKISVSVSLSANGFWYQYLQYWFSQYRKYRLYQ